MRYRGVDLRAKVLSEVGSPYVDSREVQKNTRDNYEYSGNYNFAAAPADQLRREPNVSPVTGLLQRLGFLPAGVPAPEKRKVTPRLLSTVGLTCGWCGGAFPCFCSDPFSNPLGEDGD